VSPVVLTGLQSDVAIDITIRVPDELGRRLEQYRDRLPELLERGLRDLQVEGSHESGDEQSIVSLLASRPTPEQVLAIRPSERMQTRVGELLARSQDGQLSRAEESELERHLFLEHLVRLAKASALEQLRPRG
jgi:hypothetical protein